MLSWFQGENTGNTHGDGIVASSSSAAGSRQNDNHLLQMVTFNQKKIFIAVATLKGFHVFAINADSFQERAFRLFPVAEGTSKHYNEGELQSIRDKDKYKGFTGVKIVEMMYRSNILALVGESPNPPFGSRNEVVFWDNHAAQPLGKISVRSPILAVRLHTNVIVIVQKDRIKVYEHDFRERKSFETISNPTGIVALSPETENAVLAFPFVTRGMVRCEMIDMDKKNYIKAHESDIACLALNSDGTRLATCSKKGTLIRIFDTYSGDRLKEVRRGSTHARIWDIAFSKDSRYMCCVASSGSLHLFHISDTVPDARASSNDENNNAPNRRSSLGVLAMVGVNWAQSEWSLAEHKEEAFTQEGCKCAFGPLNSQVRVITKSGLFYHVTFDLLTGQAHAAQHDIMPTLESAEQRCVY